jgi:hypothetical protein
MAVNTDLLHKILEALDPEDEDSYRSDDPEGAMDYVYSLVLDELQLLF